MPTHAGLPKIEKKSVFPGGEKLPPPAALHCLIKMGSVIGRLTTAVLEAKLLLLSPGNQEMLPSSSVMTFC